MHIYCRIYFLGRICAWIKRQGGVQKFHETSYKKSGLLYDVIDKSNGFYVSPVDKAYRSRINVPFRIGSASGVDTLERAFLTGAEALNMIALEGHRTVGGIRASLYNAVTVEEVKVLAKYMTDFYHQNKNNQ